MDVQVGGVRAFEMSGPQTYRAFWEALFGWVSRGNDLPKLITFNYDLVLERSLVQELTHEIIPKEKSKLPFDNFVLHYHYTPVPDSTYQLELVRYRDDLSPKQRNTIKYVDAGSAKGNTLDIEILKLHGSLNFHSHKPAKVVPHNFMFMVKEPYILPPVFNKMLSGSPGGMWKCALDHLRRAKNIIIIGYSLPQTDIYMQYFLKAGVGPNVDLNKIFVFDPVLFSEKDTSIATAMKERYASCFSTQLRRRICFSPAPDGNQIIAPPHLGTTLHFVTQILQKPESIFFGL